MRFLRRAGESLPPSFIRNTDRSRRLTGKSSALVGISRSMGEVILGRVISGCGGSALNVLGMLVISGMCETISLCVAP